MSDRETGGIHSEMLPFEPQMSADSSLILMITATKNPRKLQSV